MFLFAFLPQDLFLSFGFDSSSSVVNIGIIDSDGQKYVMDEYMDEFNQDKARAFISEFVVMKGIF